MYVLSNNFAGIMFKPQPSTRNPNKSEQNLQGMLSDIFCALGGLAGASAVYRFQVVITRDSAAAHLRVSTLRQSGIPIGIALISPWKLFLLG
jgi:hypothetical protein